LAEAPAEDLDALVRRVDPDRWLSSRFISDPEKRADVVALYAFDYELRRAIEATTNPIMAEIRLTWWSEALDEVYGGGPVRRHPVADAVAALVRRREVPRRLLEETIEARLQGGEPQTITTAAARVLDPGVDDAAMRELAAAWARRTLDGGTALSARRISAAAFPAVAHLALVGRSGAELARRLRLTWAVARGRL
jgi:phytoene synthase